MNREWKPGTVAMVTWKAMGASRTEPFFRTYRRAVAAHVWQSPEGTWIGDATAKEVCPLVVIDPEDREQVERLAALLWPHYTDNRRAHLHKSEITADALRSLIAPPKPEEPTGLGAVVEDAEGARWVRHQTTGGGAWRLDGISRTYDRITSVRVLSEGVTA